MTLVFPLLLLLAAPDSAADLSKVAALGFDQVAVLMSKGCEHGTVVAPSDPRFEGMPGEEYTACYRSDHTLLYTTATEERVGWWHLSGTKEAVVVCRGSDPRQVACRLVKKAGDEFYGVGATSGTVRYRFTIGAPPK